MTKKSCLSCPSYVPGSEVQDLLGTQYGPDVAYCRSRGIPLGTAKMDSEATLLFWDRMAQDCERYGKDLNSQDKATKQRSGFVGGVSFAVPQREISQEAPTNCQTCVYYTSPPTTAREYGWSVGLCPARGLLIPGRRMSPEAKSCGVGVAVSSTTRPEPISLTEFAVLPVYGDLGPKDLDAAVRWTPPNYVDPADYETDIPVSDAHRESGIRAWRKIEHPNLGGRKKPLHLPIFDPEFFDPEERAKIPQAGDDSRPELYVDYQGLLWGVAVNMLGLDRTPVLIGPAGTGKTEFYNYLAWTCQLPFDRISITSASEVWDILGKHLVKTDPASKESVTTWIDGRLPRRWRLPGVLCIDEPNTGPNEIWQAIRPLTDNSKQLVLDQDEGQLVKRHPWCMFGMAMNPSWDLRYIGTNELNEADGNRLGAVWVDYPPEDIERQIIVSKCNAEGYEITQAVLDDVMKIAADIRTMADPSEGVLQVSWGVRLQVAAAMYTQYLTHIEAYSMTIADRLDPQQRELVLNVVKGHDVEASVTGPAGTATF